MAFGGVGALLVSPFTVEWGCYAQAEGVDESEFCLFLLVIPVRCISSISPRFYFRKHAFFFLPLVAILVNPKYSFSFFSAPGLELRTSHFLGKCFYHSIHSASP
jgi:hypothetical protein